MTVLTIRFMHIVTILMQDGVSSLDIACVHNKMDTIKILIDNGANVNLKDKVRIQSVQLLCIV